MSPETEAVSFPAWKSALANTGWPEARQAEYRREILAFLHLCKVRRAPAAIMLAKEYLAERARQGPNSARGPLLWFFQAGKRGQTRPATPAMARSRARGERARWGPWRDPSGKLAGTFGDGSRTIRGRFEGVLAAEAPSDQAGEPGDGAEPGGGSTTICFRGPHCLRIIVTEGGVLPHN